MVRLEVPLKLIRRASDSSIENRQSKIENYTSAGSVTLSVT